MNLIKEAAKFIGWLTGMLAGIVAILYAFGYLVVQTQLHLLGVNALLPSGREYYLQEGANFFLVTGIKLSYVVLGIVALGLIVCVPLSMVAKSEKGSNWLTGAKERFIGRFEKHQWLWQAAVLLVMICLLFYPLVNNLDLFRAPMEIAGLLQAQQADSAPSPMSEDAGKVWTLLTTGETERLDNLYLQLLVHCMFAGFLLVLVQRLTSDWPLKSFLIFPFVLVFAIYLFLLPLNYGILEKRIEFPSVEFISTVEKVSSVDGDLLLLKKTEQEFILWDRGQKKVLWFPGDKMAKVKLGQPRPVFKKNPEKGQEVR